jgi:hypothetical protein
MKKCLFLSALVLVCILSACSIANKKIAYSAVVVDAVTGKPIASLPFEFIRKAPSYMQKDQLNTSGTTNAQGMIILDTRVVGDRTYSLNINLHNGNCVPDTNNVVYKYLAGGTSMLGADFNTAKDTIKIRPAGALAFSASDNTYQTLGTQHIIVEVNGNRVYCTNQMNWPEVVPNFAPQGLIDGSAVYLSPHNTYECKYYKVINGVPQLFKTENVYVPNMYLNNPQSCGEWLQYSITP